MSYIELNQEVCFLSFGKLYSGTVVTFKEGTAIIKEEQTEEIMRVAFQYVIDIETKFSVVQTEPCYHNKPKVRFDLTTYPVKNKTWESWINPKSWIQEVFDPVELRLVATYYGLEL